MSKKAAVFWTIAGLPLTFLDAWLSMQAMFGLLAPKNIIMWSAAVCVGLFFTAFAVLAETFGMRRTILGLFAWSIIFILDMGTSVLCAIWYGQLHHSFHSRINLSHIYFTPGNWIFTSIYVFLVIIAAAACIQLGRAFEILLTGESGHAKEQREFARLS